MEVRTPGMQRIRTNFSIGSSIVDEPLDFDSSLNELLRQTWNIWGVTSLFGFQQDDEVVLKHYGKKLREEVSTIIPYENVKYDAKFEILESFTQKPSPSDPSPVKIILTAIGKEQEEKIIYTGIMISWRTNVVELEYDNSVKLPLILCRGTKSAMKAVHIVLGNMFDCQVIELPASEDDLKWLVPIILNPVNDEEVSEKSEVQLEYKFPGLPTSNMFTLKFKTSELIDIWTIISQSEEDENDEATIKIEHVERFYEFLYNGSAKLAGVHLGLCSLKKIILPSLTITGNRMKTSSPEALDKILLFFNEKSLEILHLLNFHNSKSFSSSIPVTCN